MKNRINAMNRMARINKKMFSNNRFGRRGMGFGQMNIIGEIIENEGFSQDQLANVLDLDKTTIAKALKRLELNELIIRKSNDEDKRKKLIYVTDEAKKMQSMINSHLEEESKLLFEGISDEELNDFENTLNKIENNIEGRRNDMRGFRRELITVIENIDKDGITEYDLKSKLNVSDNEFSDILERLALREMIEIKDNKIYVVKDINLKMNRRATEGRLNMGPGNCRMNMKPGMGRRNRRMF